MMEESLRGEFRVSSLDHRCDELNEAARFPEQFGPVPLSLLFQRMLRDES